MDWSHGHNGTIHNGISRIGFYTGGMKARFRDQDLADEWVKESNKWLEANKDHPFFLYFAAHDIHVPRVPNERFIGKSGLGPRGDCIVEFDWCVGELMKTLDRLGLAENTLVVVCSDNGPVLDDGYKDQAVELLASTSPPARISGGKYSVLEGGTRTPFITRWKGRIQPGVSEQVVCTIDFPASFAALTGQAVPANGCLDSVNVLDALVRKTRRQGPRLPAATGQRWRQLRPARRQLEARPPKGRGAARQESENPGRRRPALQSRQGSRREGQRRRPTP